MCLYLRNVYLMLAALLLFFSCENKKQDSSDEKVIKNYDKQGRLLQEIIYDELGKPDRVVKDYYKNGQVFQEAHYVNGYMQGFVKRYFEDGTLLSETPYDSGKIHGVENKYRKDGKLSYEAPYHKGFPCKGLKEYLLDGSLKTKYPFITITPIDNILRDEQYILEVALSDATTSVEYYSGKLKNGNCFAEGFEEFSNVKKGVLRIEYAVPPGRFLMEQIDVIAKMKTVQGNYYILERHYNVAVENRF